jgi:hypothetical protein
LSSYRILAVRRCKVKKCHLIPFTIPDVALKHRVENSSHGIKTAKIGDFRWFSAAFAGPAVSLGAIDPGFRAFVWLRWQMPQLPRQSGAGDFPSVTDFQIREVPTNRLFDGVAEDIGS